MGRIIPNPKARLLDQVREVMRVKHDSIRTEQTYIQWIKKISHHLGPIECPCQKTSVG